MKLSIPKSNTENRPYRCFAVASALFLVLFATAALADAIDDGLPPDTPEAVKVGTRQAIQNGLEQESVIKLTRAMLQDKFDEQQIQLAHALMIEAKNSGMPVQPLVNKAFEGMAKGVPPPLIVNAMETVQFRNAFAFQRAAKFSNDRSRTENLGLTLAAGLAAGLSWDDADKINGKLQQRTAPMNSDRAYSLALECYQTVRDVSRLGVSSQDVVSMLSMALNKGFNHEDMHALRNSFVAQARQSEPQNLARSYTAAIKAGKGFHGEPRGSGNQGGGPGLGGTGPGGGEGPGGAGAGSGGSGGDGPGGDGSGGGGSGGDGSGGGGSGGGGSGGGGGGSR
ncbi:MAG: hypothetical protein JSW26_13930 [Desulfobacterales bacterium]|nr:MAG: hypothetical protein JSW26_13930 [Desulfobacterales bacterium]